MLYCLRAFCQQGISILMSFPTNMRSPLRRRGSSENPEYFTISHIDWLGWNRAFQPRSERCRESRAGPGVNWLLGAVGRLEDVEGAEMLSLGCCCWFLVPEMSPRGSSPSLGVLTHPAGRFSSSRVAVLGAEGVISVQINLGFCRWDQVCVVCRNSSVGTRGGLLPVQLWLPAVNGV